MLLPTQCSLRRYDQYSDYGHSQRYERGSHYRDTYSSDGYAQRRSFEGHHERDRRGEPPKGGYVMVMGRRRHM